MEQTAITCLAGTYSANWNPLVYHCRKLTHYMNYTFYW